MIQHGNLRPSVHHPNTIKDPYLKLIIYNHRMVVTQRPIFNLQIVANEWR